MTGHAWPLIFTRRKNSGPKKRTARIQYAPDQRRRGHVLSGSVSLTEPLRREEPRGQLRLSLTIPIMNEWPVNWHCSSADHTTESGGGCRRSSTVFPNFSANCGSLLNLNVFTRCGFNLCARQIRLTEEALTPTTWAKLRVLQW